MPTERWRIENADKLRRYRRKWYSRNKTHAINKTLKRKQNMRKWLSKYKGNLCCIQCGENHIACLEFHHKNPNEKDLTISATITQGWGKLRILEEISKCEVYCSNCHRKLHFDD